jgi:hypothetical protein
MEQRNNEKSRNFDQLPGENICWVSYIYPFTIIVPDGEDPLVVPLDEINSNSYDNGKLCRIISARPLKELPGLDLLICYDGAMAIPAAGNFAKKEAAVNYFNYLFACFLLGGFRLEAVDTRDVVTGTLHESRLIWPVGFGDSTSSLIHAKLRMRLGNSIDNIILSNPRHIYLSDFLAKITKGSHIFATIPNLTPTFLITGFTELKYNNWSTALSNLWISIEQLTDFLWKERVVTKSKKQMTAFPMRIKSMKEDSRTWSTTIKHEFLFQNQLITEELFGLIFPARQARNKLVHEGQPIGEIIAINLSRAVLMLLDVCLNMPDRSTWDVPVDNFGYRNHFTVRESSFGDWQVLSAKLNPNYSPPSGATIALAK